MGALREAVSVTGVGSRLLTSTMLYNNGMHPVGPMWEHVNECDPALAGLPFQPSPMKSFNWLRKDTTKAFKAGSSGK